MKGGLAAGLAALAATKASGLVPWGNVIVAAVSDEGDAAVLPEPTQGAILLPTRDSCGWKLIS